MWGREPERVINMALSRGIYLWDIRRNEAGKFTFKARLGGYKALSRLVRRCGCRMKITQKKGAPFLFMRLGQRKMLVAGLLLFCVTLYLLSSFIWFIEISGNEKVKTEEITHFLAMHGVKVGAPKSGFMKDKVTEQMLAEIPRLAWAGIQVRGSGVIIEVSEKALVPAELESEAADLVAAQDGRIEELLVMKGVPLVWEGDLVQKGQVLVAGKTMDIQARALVRARVERRVIGQCPIREEIDRDTGKKAEITICRFKGWDIVIQGPRLAPYEHYRTVSRSQKLLPGRIPDGLVEIINVTYIEQERKIHEWGLEGAYLEAVSRARTEAMESLPQDCRILTERHEPLPAEKADLIQTGYFLETVEDIGAYGYN
jgi:similar to stage IV sporulation protein